MVALAAAAVAGSLATSKATPVAVALLAAAIGCTLLWHRLGMGFLIGLLVAATVDALPGPNLELTRLPVGVYGIDVADLALLGVLLSVNARAGFSTLRESRLGRAGAVWSMLFLSWWLVTLGRTVLSGADPSLNSAVYFSHDFALFGLLVPLAIEPFRDPRIRNTSVITLAAACCGIAIVQLLGNFGHPIPALLHENSQTLSSGSISRVYASSTNLLTAGAAFGLGLVMLSPNRIHRALAAVVTAVCFTALALSLTRALYLGFVLGLAGALILWIGLGGPLSQITRAKLLRAAALGAAASVLLISYEPAVIATSAVNGVASRVTSIVGAASSQNPQASTLAVRAIAARNLEQLLGSKWPIGLGFLNPKQHYVPELPQGSIRDSDTGVLNVVMTMGVVGAILLYAPLVVLLFLLIRQRITHRRITSGSWVTFGSVLWLILALSSSITLVILFSAPGLCVTAIVLGIAASCLIEEDDHAQRRYV
jgi:hypothetical protein